jgi:hypothetical protein
MSAMNELNVNLQHSILALSTNGWSSRRIARELGINRETVGKYLRSAQPKPAISTPGSEPDPDSKPAISTVGSERVVGAFAKLSPLIEAAAALGLSAQRFYRTRFLSTVSRQLPSCKTICSAFAEPQPIAFVRMEVEPGAEAQIDFRQGAWVVTEGKRSDRIFFEWC